MKLDLKQLRRLGQKIVATRPKEFTCDEWLTHVASYLEAEAAGQEIQSDLEHVRHHLKICPECAEEYEAIKRAIVAIE